MIQMSFRLLALGISLTIISTDLSAQTRSERKAIKRLKADIEYLASDELEGRRTGSEGEQKAAAYIESQYRKEGIAPFRDQYQHPFQFTYGREIAPASSISIGGTQLDQKQAFPLPFSANTAGNISSEILADVFEDGTIWMIALYNDRDEAADAHFDYEKAMFDRAREARKRGASAVLFYDNFGARYPPVFNSRSEFDPLDIPVAFLTRDAFQKYVEGRDEGVVVSLNTEIRKTQRTGTNIAAYIDNKALFTVVIGAHYDHLGYGEDGTSLDAKTHSDKDGNKPASLIHNGADDNASGTAGLIELAKRIKKRKLRNYNYLFAHFSGEELGLLGSKAFVRDLGLDSSKVAYMINMDMIGRLNDSTHALTVGGVGTSPAWGPFVSAPNKHLKINIDSSGVGPSDHTSFYHAGIPVLFFFTGIHHDYHKPGDDAHKVNYFGEVKVLNYAFSIIDVMDTRIKPAFTPTRQPTVGKVRFKVTLGIMPDYSYQEAGVKVDGVTDDRPASKAGVRAGDVIIRLGEYKIQGMQSYMEALSKFKSGQTVDVTVRRGTETLTMKLTF